MADEVAAQLAVGLFPPAEGLGAGRQARVDAEVVEQALRVPLLEAFAVGLILGKRL